MRRVAIVGTGLIGTSFGLALRKAGFSGDILGVSSERSTRAAQEKGAIDAAATLHSAAESADLIFLSQPISGILSTIGQLSQVRSGVLITDAGSTKVRICQAAEQLLKAATFVGGHPMAGKEQRGAEVAEADLFAGRPWVLTPAQGASNIEAVAELRLWIERIGATPIDLDAVTHDRLVAWSSHLPQLASTALAAVISDRRPDAARVAGPGLADMTRLALSPYDVWADIIDTNRGEIDSALDAYIRELEKLRSDVRGAFEKAALLSASLNRR